MIEAPLTATGQVTTSSKSSIRAGFRKSISIDRTTKAKPGLSFLFFREQRVLIGAHQAQMVGAATLHEAQIIGMIDDAGKH